MKSYKRKVKALCKEATALLKESERINAAILEAIGYPDLTIEEVDALLDGRFGYPVNRGYVHFKLLDLRDKLEERTNLGTARIKHTTPSPSAGLT